ncbi:fumarylacetoacetase [Arsenicicoccus sp. oral taxon 190]|uniref:fumarylacetoacetase n=1 Tax=Arsenicicoccus sp. oral taxon 190 TaxID=1658671 RepID=UPI00067A0079|nr:fumarylacetoacetase [Arsenicicoccus sp. oral taxon 190]AKT50706.1 fumarylacetoacetase [Arsenicicoccus sp. oral taxon 190]
MTTTWVDIPQDSPFGLDALPYGSMDTGDDFPHLGVRIGDHALDLTEAATELPGEWSDVVEEGTLDVLLAAGPDAWARLRSDIQTWLSDESYRSLVEPSLVDLDGVTMLMPFTVGDYVDFYASENHASNVGRIFRPDSEPLTPNWKHLPIGYHGRSQTVVVSGSEVPRPRGQRRTPDGDVVFGPSVRLDIEVELGYVVGVGSERGSSIAVGDFERHVFGVTITNDWSARDIQAWEYVPLGPFLGKSFATTIGGWVLPLAALQDARVDPPARDVPLQDYLKDVAGEPWGLDIEFEVRLNDEVVSRPPYAQMYWTPAQMLAHTTINGASVRTGDFYASGTISGTEVDQRGAFLEMTWGGRDPITLADGSTRTFLEDGDEVVISGTARGADGRRIGLGECRGRITPAR